MTQYLSVQLTGLSILEDGIREKWGASALAFKKLLDQHVYCTQNNDFDGAQIFILAGIQRAKNNGAGHTCI